MKKTLLIFSIFFLILIQVPQAEQLQSQEQYYQALVDKDPNSESYRYRYASYLSQKERYDDAEVQLTHLFKINPQHTQGRKLEKDIKTLKSIEDPQKRKQEALRITMENLDHAMKKLEKTTKSLQSTVGKERLEEYQAKQKEREQDLIKKYRISEQLMKKQYQPGTQESKAISLGVSYETSALKEKAPQYYDQLVQQYPNSPAVQSAYLQFLMRKKEYTQAIQLNYDAIKKHRNEIILRITYDGLQKISQTASSEQKESIALETQEKILAWNSFRVNYILKRVKLQ